MTSPRSSPSTCSGMGASQTISTGRGRGRRGRRLPSAARVPRGRRSGSEACDPADSARRDDVEAELEHAPPARRGAGSARRRCTGRSWRPARTPPGPGPISRAGVIRPRARRAGGSTSTRRRGRRRGGRPRPVRRLHATDHLGVEAEPGREAEPPAVDPPERDPPRPPGGASCSAASDGFAERRAREEDARAAARHEPDRRLSDSSPFSDLVEPAVSGEHEDGVGPRASRASSVA